MRHRNGLRKLNRTSEHRQAMLRNMCNSLLTHEAIKTTVPKAKELRRVVEPLITLGKEDSEANRRLAFSRLRDSEIVEQLGDDAAVAQPIEREAPVGERGLLAERDDRLDHAAQLLRLRQRRLDDFVPEQRAGHVPQHREAMAARAVELSESVSVPHFLYFL